MSNLEMRVYTAFNGVESVAKWRGEREFDAVKNYLKEIGAQVMGISENNKPKEGVYVYIETKEQFDALIKFANSLGQES